jgi:hypothetical protein
MFIELGRVSVETRDPVSDKRDDGIGLDFA